MKNQIQICEYEMDFFCPMCGSKVNDMSKPEIQPCKHLRYASVSEAPGMPQYVHASLRDRELDECNELANVDAITKAVKGPTMRFTLGGGNGHIDLYLIFEVLHEDE